jgi:peptidoglycan/xylan/chitin deacetylase (PgdA/CDA1 family)
MNITDFFVGPALRKISSNDKSLYLTFDDGPFEENTASVIDLLRKHKAKATFFVVVERAQKQKTLCRDMLAGGHSIGNHSLDHRYSQFFGSHARLKKWVSDSKKQLDQLIGCEAVGFRSPAGVRTPVLNKVLRELQEPLILWNSRFYDTTFKWNKAAAVQSLRELAPGSIVLLHDRQRATHFPTFLKTLDAYLRAARQSGFELRCLEREVCVEQFKQLRTFSRPQSGVRA